MIPVQRAKNRWDLIILGDGIVGRAAFVLATRLGLDTLFLEPETSFYHPHGSFFLNGAGRGHLSLKSDSPPQPLSRQIHCGKRSLILNIPDVFPVAAEVFSSPTPLEEKNHSLRGKILEMEDTGAVVNLKISVGGELRKIQGKMILSAALGHNNPFKWLYPNKSARLPGMVLMEGVVPSLDLSPEALHLFLTAPEGVLLLAAPEKGGWRLMTLAATASKGRWRMRRWLETRTGRSPTIQFMCPRWLPLSHAPLRGRFFLGRGRILLTSHSAGLYNFPLADMTLPVLAERAAVRAIARVLPEKFRVALPGYIRRLRPIVNALADQWNPIKIPVSPSDNHTGSCCGRGELARAIYFLSHRRRGARNDFFPWVEGSLHRLLLGNYRLGIDYDD